MQLLDDQYLDARFNVRAGEMLHSHSYSVPTRMEIRPGPEGHALHWDISASEAKPAQINKCLGRFMRLADDEASPARFLTFARKYGILGICGHKNAFGEWIVGRPECDQCQQVRTIGLSGCLARGEFGTLEKVWAMGTQRHPLDEWLSRIPRPIEPLGLWRELARELRAILRSSAYFQDGRRIEREDAVVLHDLAGPLYEDWEPEHALQPAIDYWLQTRAGLKTYVLWDAKSRRHRLRLMGSAGLLGTLGAELASWLTSPHDLVVCSNCPTYYKPGRITDPNYCDACKGHRQAPWAANKRALQKAAANKA